MKDWAEEDIWVQDWVLDSGSAVFEVAYLFHFQIEWAKEYNTSWYRSKEKKGGNNPFTSFMMNKKWTLEEEFNIHLLMYHQVIISSNYFSKQHFDIQGWIDTH